MFVPPGDTIKLSDLSQKAWKQEAVVLQIKIKNMFRLLRHLVGVSLKGIPIR